LDRGSIPLRSTKSIFFEVLVVTSVAKTASEYAFDGAVLDSTDDWRLMENRQSRRKN